MKKIAILASGLFLFLTAVMAQSGYKVHVIKEGESLTKLANRYGTTVGDIMRMNKMTTDSKLSVGEKVKIPVKDNGDNQATVVPATHVVQKGETLYQLSRKYNLSVNDIRDWNNIEGNSIKVGETLRLSPNTAGTDSNNIGVATAPPAADKAEVNTTAPAENNQNVSDNTTQAVVNTPAQSQDNSEITPVKERNSSVFDPSAAGSAEGLYRNAYKSEANGTELITKGLGGIFKSASGWKDGKYFILMNEVSPGTLVKVQANGKTIYAKVLWNLGNVKENTGLSYRISDAGVNALGLSGDQFNIIVSYFK